jgi:hypothetical protein
VTKITHKEQEKIEQEKILSYLIDIPPLEYLQACDTDDRKQHWETCKNFYSCLYHFMKNHFAGLPLPTESFYREDLQVSMVFPTSEQKDLLFQRVGLYLDYYLKYYSVLSWGWKYISPVLDKEKQRTGNNSIPETPGQALIGVIDQYLDGLFYVYFPEKVTGNYYREYSPRKAYKKHKEYEKNLLLREDLENLNTLEKKKLASFDKELEKESELLEPFVGLTKFYIDLCLPHQKNDPTLKRRLVDLETTKKILQAESKRNQSPRGSARGYAINQGVLLESRKEGGTYKNP